MDLYFKTLKKRFWDE